MARKATDKPRRGENTPRRRTSSKGGAKRPGGDISERVISAALDLAAGEGWRSVSMAAITAKAGLTLAQVHGAFPSKAAIVEGFFGRIDAQVLAGGEGTRTPAIRRATACSTCSCAASTRSIPIRPR